MSNITIGQIVEAIGIIGTIGGVFVGIYKILKSIDNFKDDVADQFKNIKDEVKKVDMAGQKNYLVRFIKDVKVGNPLSYSELERGLEAYKEYCDNGGNSYIHAEWEIIEPKVKDLLNKIG